MSDYRVPPSAESRAFSLDQWREPEPPRPRAAGPGPAPVLAGPLSLDSDPNKSVTPTTAQHPGSADDEESDSWTPARCESPRGFVKVYCRLHGSVCWVPRRCNHCHCCRELRTAEVRLRAKVGIANALAARPGSYVVMLTLTSLPGMTWDWMVESWAVFLRWLKRVHPSAFTWLRVAETGHDTGMKHFHVLLVGWKGVPQRVLSDAWRRATGGAYVIDIREVNPSKGAAYATKYITKALADRDDETGCRRPFQFSQGWPSAKDVRGVRECRYDILGEVGPAGPTGTLSGVTKGGVYVVSAGNGGCFTSRPLNLADHLYLMALPYDLTRPPR